MKKSMLFQLTSRRRSLALSYRCNSKRVAVELDGQVQDALETNKTHPKRHPGALGNRNTLLPDHFKLAMFKTVGDESTKRLMDEAEELARYLHARKPPMEQDAENELVSNIRQEVTDGLNVELNQITDELRAYYDKVIESKVEQITKQRKYNWQQLDYTRHKGLQYMVCRSAREYAINLQVLKELKNRFSYSPKTIFDFGSGVGTVLWAADSLWSESLKEAFAVDASPHMNEIAREMLNHADRKHLKKILYQRQFLPMSPTPQYDVVVSSFSLLELHSVKARLEVVLNLWNRTKDFLVLVESGTIASFQVIREARDFLLWSMRKKTAPSSFKGHIVSPCPHEFQCPMQLRDNKPCNFSATYTTYPQKSTVKKELYSYVILRKGSRSSEEPDWPRVVRPILVRHKHAICRMCTPEGKLTEVIFSPGKHGKIMHRCARQSRWGDRLPISIKDIPADSQDTWHDDYDEQESDFEDHRNSDNKQ